MWLQVSQPDGQKTEVPISSKDDDRSRSHDEDEERLQAEIAESVSEMEYFNWVEAMSSRTPQGGDVILTASSRTPQGDDETATKLVSMGLFRTVNDDVPPPPRLDEQEMGALHRGEESRRSPPGPPPEGYEGEHRPADRATGSKGPLPGVQAADAERQSVAAPLRNVPDLLRELKLERPSSSQALEPESWTAPGKGSGDARGAVRKSPVATVHLAPV